MVGTILMTRYAVSTTQRCVCQRRGYQNMSRVVLWGVCGIEHRRRRRVSSEARRRHTKTRSALRTPTWWIQEPGAAVPPGDVTIDALPSTTVRVPRRFRWTRGVLRRTDESYEGAVSPPRRLFVGAAEKRPQTSSAHLMLSGGPCTQSDET